MKIALRARVSPFAKTIFSSCPFFSSTRTIRSSRIAILFLDNSLRSFFGECRAVGAKHQVIAPSFEQFGKFNPAKKRKRLIAHFPAVTVRTMKNAFAPQFLKTFNLRHFVNDSGCQQ